jgi:hypothetical protein
LSCHYYRKECSMPGKPAPPAETHLSYEELRRQASTISDKLAEAFNAIEDARELTDVLWRRFPSHAPFTGATVELERFEIEIAELLKELARDLGADVDEMHGEFDIDRHVRESRDILDLISLAHRRGGHQVAA